MSDSVVFHSARAQRALLDAQAISARELLDAHLAQIRTYNPEVNAIITMDEAYAYRTADTIDSLRAHGVMPGVLAGLPMVHKDLTAVKGMRFTSGSPIYADRIAEEDSHIVRRMKQAGCVSIGKSNVPEFGAGSQTFNPIFGATTNPHNLQKTCGGSSGGAAVALACRMVALADGSDMGGSLRNPAAFCGVVGFRPSPGVVANSDDWSPLSTDGPMGRNVQDVALLLAALAGYELGANMTIPIDTHALATLDACALRGKRVAWAPRWGGLPIEPALAEAFDAQRAMLVSLGCIVEDASPDFHGADEAFQTLRALAFATGREPLLATYRHLMKDTVVWNTELGLSLTGAQIANAYRLQAQVIASMRSFMQRYDVVIGPTTQVLAFDVDQPFVREINGETLPTYIDWMKSCWYITMTAHPAISIPCSMSRTGLPVGMQIVGRMHDDINVLRIATAIESAIDQRQFVPALIT